MEKYFSEEMISVQRKKLYTDNENYPNENAFRDFVSKLTPEDNYHLLCLNIDLTSINKKSHASGDRVMRTVFLKLMEVYPIFRISGDKFNLLYLDENKEELDEFLNFDNGKIFTLYWGKVEDVVITTDTLENARRKGVELMYIDKSNKTNKKLGRVREDKIIGDKGNIPAEMHETTFHKYKETMWYAVIKVNESEPEAREFFVYVFPTEFKQPMACLNTIIVIDDFIEARVYVGTGVRFGIDGIKFNVYVRFDKEGHLSVSMMKETSTGIGKYELEVETHEGCGIPVFFGKRVGKDKEIYPFKKNIYGTQEYVLWNEKENKVEICKKGIYEDCDKQYSVYADDIGIDIVEIS